MGGGSLGRVYILPFFSSRAQDSEKTGGRKTVCQPHNSVQQIPVFRVMNCCGQLHLVSVEKGDRDALYAEAFAQCQGTFA